MGVYKDLDQTVRDQLAVDRQEGGWTASERRRSRLYPLATATLAVAALTGSVLRIQHVNDHKATHDSAPTPVHSTELQDSHAIGVDDQSAQEQSVDVHVGQAGPAEVPNHIELDSAGK